MSDVDPETGEPVPPVPPPGAPEEPVISVTAITAAATAILALTVAVGVPLDDDVQAAILAVIAVIAPIVLGFVARGRVFAPATVRRVVAAERQKAAQCL